MPETIKKTKIIAHGWVVMQHHNGSSFVLRTGNPEKLLDTRDEVNAFLDEAGRHPHRRLAYSIHRARVTISA